MACKPLLIIIMAHATPCLSTGSQYQLLLLLLLLISGSHVRGAEGYKPQRGVHAYAHVEAHLEGGQVYYMAASPHCCFGVQDCAVGHAVGISHTHVCSWLCRGYGLETCARAMHVCTSDTSTRLMLHCHDIFACLRCSYYRGKT